MADLITRDELEMFIEKTKLDPQKAGLLRQEFDNYEKRHMGEIKAPPGPEELYPAAVGKAAFNTMGAPIDMINAGLAPIESTLGMQPTDTPLGGSKSLAKGYESITGYNPYHTARDFGIHGMLADMLQGGLENTMMAPMMGGAGKLLGATMPQASMTKEFISGMGGGGGGNMAMRGVEPNDETAGIREFLGQAAGSMVPELTAQTIKGGAGLALRGLGLSTDVGEDIRKTIDSADKSYYAPRFGIDGMPEELRTRLERNGYITKTYDNITNMTIHDWARDEKGNIMVPGLANNPELRGIMEQLMSKGQDSHSYNENRTLFNQIIEQEGALSDHLVKRIVKTAAIEGIDPALIGQFIAKQQSENLDSLTQLIKNRDQFIEDMQQMSTGGKSSTDYATKLHQHLLDTVLDKREYFEQRYGPLKERYGDTMIDIRPLVDEIPNLGGDTVTSKKLWAPKSVIGVIKDLATGAGIDLENIDLSTGPVQVPFKEIVHLRSEVLDQIRRMRSNPAANRNKLLKLTELMDFFDNSETGMISKLEANPENADFIKEWRATNAEYKQFKDIYDKGLSKKLLFQNTGGTLQIPEMDMVKRYMENAERMQEFKTIFGKDNPDVHRAASAYWTEQVMGNLPEGTTAEQMQRRLNKHKSNLMAEFPEVYGNLQQIIESKLASEQASEMHGTLLKQYHTATASALLGRDADTYAQSLLKQTDPRKRRADLEDLLRYGNQGEKEKSFISSYLKDIYMDDITGLSQLQGVTDKDKVTRIFDINVQKMRAKLVDYEGELKIIFGDKQAKKTIEGLATLADAIEYYQQVMLKPGGSGLPNLNAQTADAARLLLGTLTRTYSMAKGMIGPVYAAADRATAIGASVWKQWSPEKARELLAEIMTNPDAYEVFRWNFAANRGKLRGLYNGSLFNTGGREETEKWKRTPPTKGGLSSFLQNDTLDALGGMMGGMQ